MKTERKPETVPEHSGWANYPTWNIMLWINNDKTRQGYWHRQAEISHANAAKDNNVRDNIWTIDQAAKYRLGECLRDEIESNAPTSQDASMYSDIMRWGLAYVKWDDIAEALLNQINET